jgi:hypothetical protein
MLGWLDICLDGWIDVWMVVSVLGFGIDVWMVGYMVGRCLDGWIDIHPNTNIHC